jgi:trk system potassium uptake protein TrkH
VLYVSLANIVVNVVDMIITKNKNISASPIVSSLWFGFLKFTNIYGSFLNESEIFTQGLLVVVTVISIAFLLLYSVRTISELTNRTFRFRMRPYSIIALSFASIIFVGTILLFLPVSHNVTTGPVSLLDSFFTATSPVCVPGLTVVDTGKDFSPYGHIVILLLIQIGGLGIMTFGAFFAQLLGQKFSFQNKFTLQNAVSEMKISGTGRYIIAMIIATFSFEFVGAALLFVRFIKLMAFPEAVYYSIFHAVSAFCNAGFGLYSDSLTIFRGDALVNFTVMGLIVLGGIGFSVILNLYRLFRRKTQFLSLHSKIALLVSGILIVVGAAAVFVLEYKGLMAGLPIKDKILSSLFASVTSRTPASTRSIIRWRRRRP